MTAPLTEDQLETIRRLISNGRRFGVEAHMVAAALDFVVPIDGRIWTPVCPWCLDAIDHTLPDSHVHRLSLSLDRTAGGCMRCPYFGCDTLVVSLVKEIPE